MIRAIAAIDEKRGLARDGDIPWKIPEDVKYYRDKTEHSTIIMGRDTYEGFAKPLVNRRNVVISRTLQTVREGFELVHDVDAFLVQATEDIWNIGGAGIFESTLGYCDELYLTHVAGDFNCDRFFPEYDDYKLVTRSPDREQNGHRFYYAVYAKNR
nr:dihydrofolate reductase [uncultured bacterium]